jgi:zinc transport system permease protein
MNFFQDLAEFSFLQNALAAVLLIALACGAVGSFVVVRRSTYVAGSIAHCVVSGIGVARYLQVTLGWEWLHPTLGAVLSALLAALLISWIETKKTERLDSILSIIWASGMAIGICFLSITPGYNSELMSYLLGDILLVGSIDLLWMSGISIMVLGVLYVRLDYFLGTSFQSTLVKMRGISPFKYNLVFNILTALVVVAVVKLVGIMLAVAFICIPASAASRLGHRLAVILPLAMLICFISGFAGIWISYLTNWPTGATTVLCSVAIYAVCAFSKQRS